MQDRHLEGRRTPRWRGVTLAHEIKEAGVPFAMASDNTRDQFYAYGDLDMMEVFTQVTTSGVITAAMVAHHHWLGDTPEKCVQCGEEFKLDVGIWSEAGLASRFASQAFQRVK